MGLDLLHRLRRGEPRVQLGHVIVEIIIVLALAFTLAVHGLLGRGDDAEIVLGMLEIVLRHHRIPGRLRVAGQLQIFLGDMSGIATDLHVRAVALIVPRQRINMLAPAIAATLPVLILIIGSHRVALSNSRS